MGAFAEAKGKAAQNRLKHSQSGARKKETLISYTKVNNNCSAVSYRKLGNGERGEGRGNGGLVGTENWELTFAKVSVPSRSRNRSQRRRSESLSH